MEEEEAVTAEGDAEVFVEEVVSVATVINLERSCAYDTTLHEYHFFLSVSRYWTSTVTSITTSMHAQLY